MTPLFVIQVMRWGLDEAAGEVVIYQIYILYFHAYKEYIAL